VTGLGPAALLLAWVASGVAAASSLAGQRASRADLVRWGGRALVAVLVLTTVAVGVLVAALLNGDWSLVYVADHVSHDTSWPYRVAALWGGMSGSLLFWAWLLSAWTALAARRWRVRGDLGDVLGGAQATLAVTAAVFLGLVVTISPPFARLAIPAVDGGGLTPVLRHPAMLYHPPLLYAGYVALAVPFSLALAALVRRSPAAVWLAAARRCMAAALALLTAGMVAGAHWAYVELGWGGYWAWDPVENGVLLPWLAGVAFLHSAAGARQHSGGAPATAALAGLTFGLGLLGAFLTRSGATDSVHAFAEGDAVGRVLLTAVAVVAVGLAVLVGRRRSETGGEPVTLVSRRGALLVNNVVLLGLVAAVGFGTVFPVVSEWATGERVVVTGRYFAVVTTPLAIALLGTLGVGPRLPRVGGAPAALAAVSLMAAAALLLADRRAVALALIGLAGWAAALTVAEWRRRPGGGWRSRGGLLAHLGVAFLLAGVAGTTTATHRTASLVPGAEVAVRGYTLRLEAVEAVPAPDRLRAARATVAVYRHGGSLTTLRPEAVVSDAGDRVSVTALRSTPFEDLQVALRAVGDGGRTAVLEVFVTPMATWVWWGGLLVAAGLGMSVAAPVSLGRTRRAPAVATPA
jgi:cytochrome c-type biogenesis protein CcmF